MDSQIFEKCLNNLTFTEVQTKEEASGVAKLAGEIWHQHYTPIIGSEQVHYMLEQFQSTEAISQSIELDDYHYYLVYVDTKLAGYLAIKPDLAKKSLFISKFYLADLYRGKGYARTMFQFILQYAKQFHLQYIWLTVNKQNTRAIRAYEKLGFKNEGSCVQDIGHGYLMDDYRMRYAL